MNAGFVTGEQSKANVNAANNASYLNNVNQVTPYGSLNYDVTGGVYDYNGNWVPRWTATTALSPEQQALYEKSNAVSQNAYDLANKYVGRIGDATAQPFSLNGAPNAPTVPTYSGPEYNDARRNDVYNAIIQRNQSNIDRDRATLESRLANQGISLGTDAYKAGFDDYNRGVNDFRLGADIQSGQEARADYMTALQGANQQFNANAASYGMGTDARKNYITEQQMLRMQPIQETAALLGTGSGQQYPTFVPTNNYQVAPTDVGGIYGAQAAQENANYQGQLRSQQAGLGGLYGLIGAGLGGWAQGGFKSPW